MTDELISFMTGVSNILFPKQFATYYHYVVGTAPEQKTPFSDRLLVNAFEEVCSTKSGLWTRTDGTPQELSKQCARTHFMYLAAKSRIDAQS
jgi:hypothetical protein